MYSLILKISWYFYKKGTNTTDHSYIRNDLYSKIWKLNPCNYWTFLRTFFEEFMNENFYHVVTSLKSVSLLKLNTETMLFILKIKETGNKLIPCTPLNLPLIGFWYFNNTSAALERNKKVFFHPFFFFFLFNRFKL